MKREIECMLKHGLVEPSNRPWSSCVLVPKPGEGIYRVCTDHRKVKYVTNNDSYPIPKTEDCIDVSESANFVTD